MNKTNMEKESFHVKAKKINLHSETSHSECAMGATICVEVPKVDGKRRHRIDYSCNFGKDR
jgi:hypothetical protein